MDFRWDANAMTRFPCFQLRDGLITREIAYELWRELDSEIAHDDIPEDAVWEIFSETPETN